jgi:hypothetical protein
MSAACIRASFPYKPKTTTFQQIQQISLFLLFKKDLYYLFESVQERGYLPVFWPQASICVDLDLEQKELATSNIRKLGASCFQFVWKVYLKFGA